MDWLRSKNPKEEKGWNLGCIVAVKSSWGLLRNGL